MSKGPSAVIVPVCIAGTVNSIVAVKHGDVAGAFKTVIANAALLLTLTSLGGLLGYDLAGGLALLYLLGTFLISEHGKSFLNWFTDLIGGL